MRRNLRDLLAACCLTVLGFQTQAQCLDCGDGTEGAFNATVNTTIAGGVHNFTTFDIAPGVTVRVTGTQPLEINATGAVSIQGTLDVSGLAGADGVTYTNGGLGALGVAGGGNGGDGSFSSTTGPLNGSAATGAGGGGIGMGWSGGGGAGYAAVGGSTGGAGGVGGPIYGDAQITGTTAGSGGGGGSGGYDCGAGGGGAGGGYVSIFSCVSISISGTINANGGAGGSDGTGNCGGGGGGSGGSIWLASLSITNNGSLTANGGTGGASAVPGSPYYGVGGVGSVGRIRIDANSLSGTGTVVPAAGFTGTTNSVVLTCVGTDATCFGSPDGTATATATGGSGSISYLWSPSGATTATVSGLSAGCYIVIATDSNGCAATDTVCITEPTQVVATTSGTNLLCNGDCDGTALATVSGGTPGYVYLWSNGAIGNPVTNLCAGIINVTISDANGCTATNVITITEPTAIVLSETHTPAFDGNNNGTAQVTATGGTGTYTYLWSPGGMTTDTVSGLAPGNYTVVVTDSNGCSDSLSIEILIILGRAESQSATLSLFPNPAHDQIQISFQQAQSTEEIKVDWLDALGRKVRSDRFDGGASLHTQVDLSGLPAGTYLCRVLAGDQVVTRKVTLQ